MVPLYKRNTKQTKEVGLFLNELDPITNKCSKNIIILDIERVYEFPMLLKYLTEPLRPHPYNSILTKKAYHIID